MSWERRVLKKGLKEDNGVAFQTFREAALEYKGRKHEVACLKI